MSGSRTRGAVLALALVAATSFCGKAAYGQERPGFGAEVSVTEIEVPVTVLEDGEPVRGLTQGDFVLTEDGLERDIVGFEIVDLAVASEGVTSSAVLPGSLAARRYFLLAFVSLL